MKVIVKCPQCTQLGEFWVTAQQSLEGARARAMKLAEGHIHTTVNIYETE